LWPTPAKHQDHLERSRAAETLTIVDPDTRGRAPPLETPTHAAAQQAYNRRNVIVVKLSLENKVVA
jgi:hypothetical protein